MMHCKFIQTRSPQIAFPPQNERERYSSPA